MTNESWGSGPSIDAAEQKRVDRICAEIAARKAMKWSWKRYFFESASSEGSVPGEATPSMPQTQGQGSSSWTTPRRHNPIGIGLLNKTLRTKKKTRIPQPSEQSFTGIAGHHTQSSNASGYRANSENYGALPSSYRRLRKARSMLTTRRRIQESQDSPLLSPVGRSRIPRRATSFAALPTSNFRLRLKQSLTTLRPKSRVAQFSGANDGPGHDEAVQIARARFLETEQQQAECRQPMPFSFRSNVHNKPFNKSFKTSHSLDSDKSPVPIPNRNRSTQKEVGKRSFSASLRNRLRNALGKSVKEEDTIPPQQLEAQRSHFDELGADTESVSGFDAYCAEEENQDRRQSLYFPASPEHVALENRDEMPYSLDLAASRESLPSNTRSRVTSWTNSSMTGSLGLRSGMIERNRLSIIKEDGGPQQPSSSAGRHIGGVTLFQEPLQSPPSDGRPLPMVDSQRVYSALIKRINQEEAEVERTRLAFKALNQEHCDAPDSPTDARPTIRVVRSDSSLATMPLDDQPRHFSSRSCSWDQPEAGMTPEEHKENLERRKERLAVQESQSSFFPFSSEQNPSAPSPFKQFLQDRRHHERSDNCGQSSDPDGGSVMCHRDTSNYVIDRRRFGFSSDSVYSRTTNGGINDQYRSPIGSSEELSVPNHAGSELAGMATILPTVYHRSSSQPLSGTEDIGIGHTQPSEWNPWSDTLTTDRTNKDYQAAAHLRELAQIKSEQARGSDERGLSQAIARPKDSGDPKCLYAIGVAPNGNVTRPKPRLNGSKSHTGLLYTARADTLKPISNQVEDKAKTGDSFRKLSPGILAKKLKGKKSQLMSKPDDTGKENVRAEHSESPPMSTPGKLHLQARNGNTTGRLRKKGSEAAIISVRGLQVTPQSAFSSLSTTPSRCEESPSEKAKDHLVARLSRPFNMDVPPHNRPFDSMYLGKRTPGHPDTIGSSRLSVAPYVPTTLDGSDAQARKGQGVTDANGLSSEPASIGRNAARMLGLFNSKRMVSNFLKSRRTERSRSESGQSTAGGSPAFL
ncbi:hypothetical protein A1O1_08723 [Capronia coronata CBS 617.96]|uniref:Uncharacterized protein n=1 Tax=Capronia coronata CBS 617.96 TaxID=1182541 RepID=W9XJ82_9EURO|nr:uncharacterized protein A1O1_08723 [Capronia coronata CBS 617.96]EXJ80577.1 hypothetical protein A1O1_08723 [Capronia coronata CBS 617.96]